VVATYLTKGPAEILVDSACGELVPVANPESLAAAIARALDKPAPPQLLRDRAADFSIERAVDNYAALALTAQQPAP